MRIALRPAGTRDFDYCKRLYFAGMKTIIEELRLNQASQEASFQEQWQATQVRIIALDSSDIGWLQSFIEDDAIFLAQLFVDGPFQRRGIGTDMIHRLIGEANQTNRAVRLNVVKINPAVRLYERLGFRIVREDERKFYMKRDPDVGTPS
ncbi:MAG TPA: GNAT family N-acetyltransferase [Terriglobales bacterium]|jgi:ribosomal protein S18 acetylase RimI-like enzyme|nr:GNAT family N-acetyltransferase [Terriglobales bacterium]